MTTHREMLRNRIIATTAVLAAGTAAVAMAEGHGRDTASSQDRQKAIVQADGILRGDVYLPGKTVEHDLPAMPTEGIGSNELGKVSESGITIHDPAVWKNSRTNEIWVGYTEPGKSAPASKEDLVSTFVWSNYTQLQSQGAESTVPINHETVAPFTVEDNGRLFIHEHPKFTNSARMANGEIVFVQGDPGEVLAYPVPEYDSSNANKIIQAPADK